MNNRALFISEREYKLLHIISTLCDIDVVEYSELSNEYIYTLLHTLVLTKKCSVNVLAAKMLERMEYWYQDQIFFSELEEILNRDDDNDGEMV